jgi:molybdenum cofactor cytidylyltransferase
MQPVILLLASGQGKRFLDSGGATHKLQAQLGDHTVLEHSLATVRASGLQYHLEQGDHAGMGDAIAAAVRACLGAASWLILPADLPLLQAQTIRQVAQAPANLAVVRPIYRGRPGHPVRFSRLCAEALLALSGNHGAAAVVRAYGLTELSVDDPGCVTDVDTQQDLQQALRIMRLCDEA